MMAEGPLNGDSTRSSENPTTMEESSREGEPVVIVQHKTTCGECKKELKNPHLLCCLHSVCAECLPNMAVEGERVKCGQCGDTSTHCSSSKVFDTECRADIVRCVPVPHGPLSRYMEGMKIIGKASANVPIRCEVERCKNNNAPSVMFCVNCWKFMCEVCRDGHDVFCQDHTTIALQKLLDADETQGHLSKRKSKHTCPHHSKQELLYCCKTCNKLLCQVCTTAASSGSGQKHILEYIDPEWEPMSGESSACRDLKITRCMAMAFEAKCEAAQTKLRTRMVMIDEEKEAALGEVNKAFETIQKALDKRKEEFHQQITATAEQKKIALSSQLKRIDELRQSAADVHSPVSLLSSGSSHDMLACKDLVQTHQSVVTSKWCQEELESTVSCMVTFDPRERDAVLKALEVFGVVVDGACPVKCRVEPKPEDIQSNGSDPVTLKLTTFGSKGIACKRGGDKVEGFVVSKSPIPGPAIKARVVDGNSGRYTLSFPSTYCGECELYIRVNGSEIRGSPFAVTLYCPPVWPKLSRNVKDIKVPKGRLQFPHQPGCVYGVATSQNGTIFVSDCSNREIHVFSEERKHMRVFGEEGSGEGQLNIPYGLAVDSEGLVYVANHSNNRVEVLREDGTFVRQIGAGQLKHPWNVTINNHQVYIADTHNNRISIYTMQGQLVHHIGERGSGPGQFNFPSAVTFSPDGDMYVAEWNHHIQVLDANGQFKREFGKGELRSARDLVITADGDVLVADYSNNCVAVFDSCGNLVHSFNVNNPFGLAIDSDGDILVTDSGNKQVVIF